MNRVNIERAARRILGFWILLACCSAGRGEEPKPAVVPQKVWLQNNDQLTGELLDSSKPGVLSLRTPLFSNPLEIPVSCIQRLEFPERKAVDGGDLAYSFELSGGDVLFGKLTALNSEEVEIESPDLGKLHLQTSRVRRIARGVLGTDGTRVPELVYLGPNGLDKWEQLNSTKAREENGALVLEQDGSAVSSDVGLPLKAIIECELSWKGGSEFLFAFGVSKSDATVKNAFGIEVWGNDLVARRETAGEADVASIKELDSKDGSIHLLIFLNRIEGQMQVFSSAGKQLADLEVRELDPRLVTGVRLALKKGEVRLSRLRVSNWSGELIPAVAWEKPRIHKTDGTLVLGRPVGFDPTTGEYTVRNDEGEMRIPIDQIANIFVPSGETPALSGVRLQLANGTRISGQSAGIKEGKILLQSPGIREELKPALATVHTLTSLQRSDESPNSKGNATLASEGVKLQGALVKTDSAKSAERGPLVWQSEMSEGPAYFRPEADAIIRIQRGKPVPGPLPAKKGEAGQKPAANLEVFGFDLPRKAPTTTMRRVPTSSVSQQPCLYLVSGDTIPCKLTRIDERGVEFVSTMTTSKFVRHELVKGVVLIPARSETRSSGPVQHNFPPGVRIMLNNGRGPNVPNPGGLDPKKQERLLTLPRMQKSNPPTHLICARNGDYLRGRIIEMNEETVRVELRLETREIPRDRISRIIWLHPEAMSKKEGEAAVPPAEMSQKETAVGGMLVHIVRSDGIRLTFTALNVDDEKIVGVNEVLGNCEVPMTEVGQLLLGKAIESSAAQLAFQQFKLQSATEPLAPPDPSESGGSERNGKESPLVGKEAPEIELKRHDGGQFSLKESRGRIVLVDFWASWCGPCRRTLPQVHAVAEEFREKGVDLMTINLEESPDQISGALARLKLEMPVAMDTNGKVGGKYGVTSIPSTLIIDRTGKVARVYIGAGEGFQEELRGALRELLGEVKPDEKPMEVVPAPEANREADRTSPANTDSTNQGSDKS